MREASPKLSHLPRTPEARGKLKSYLKKPPLATAIFLIALAVPLLLVGYAVFKVKTAPPRFSMFWERPEPEPVTAVLFKTMIWGAVPLAIGLWILLDSRISSPSAEDDSYFDEALLKDIDYIRKRAHLKIELSTPAAEKRWGIDRSDRAPTEPLVWCTGCSERHESWGKFGDADPGWKQGHDETTRYRIYRTTILFLAEHHLAHYLCDFNVETGMILSEETVDCHYKDVQIVTYMERKIRALDLPDWWERAEEGAMGIFRSTRLLVTLVKVITAKLSAQEIDFSMRIFEICLGSKSLQIPIRISQQDEDLDLDSKVDPIVSRVRFLLREKRMAYVRMLGSSEGHPA